MVFELKSQVLGFEELQQIKLEKIDDMFAKAVNAEGEHPSFVLVNPFMLREYDFEVPDYIKILMDIDENSQLAIYNVMVIQSPLENSLVNFIAPFVFNFDNNSAAQIVLDNNIYPQYGILEPLNAFMQQTQE